jgi:hypothetical protein
MEAGAIFSYFSNLKPSCHFDRREKSSLPSEISNLKSEILKSTGQLPCLCCAPVITRSEAKPQLFTIHLLVPCLKINSMTGYNLGYL